MPIYKKINGSYTRISPLYIKDDSGNYFDPLGGVYVKDGGIYHKVYPEAQALYVMIFCDESHNRGGWAYLDDYSSTYSIDKDWWNYVKTKVSNKMPLRAICWIPSESYDETDIIPPGESAPSPFTVDIIPSEGDRTIFQDTFDNWINEDGVSGGTIYAGVDESGSTRYMHIKTEWEAFTSNLPPGWNVVKEEIVNERWLKWGADYINDNY